MGLIVGTGIGGLLATPAINFPGVFSPTGLFARCSIASDNKGAKRAQRLSLAYRRFESNKAGETGQYDEGHLREEWQALVQPDGRHE